MSDDSAKSSEFNPCLISSLQFLSHLSIWIATAAGGIVLLGWITGFGLLHATSARTVVMNPSSALGFVLVGISLWAWTRQEGMPAGWARAMSTVAAVLVLLLGMAALLEYAFGLHLSLHSFVVFLGSAELLQQGDPWRMAEASATGFVFTGIALLALNTRRERRVATAQSIACLVFLICLFGLLDDILNSASSEMHIPLMTVVNFAFVSCALLLLRPDQGLMSVIAGESLGGSIARRLLPAAIVVSLLIAWLGWKGQALGYYSLELGVAFSTAIQIVLLVLLIWGNAKSLERVDLLRKGAEEAGRRELEQINRRAQADISRLLAAHPELRKQLEESRSKQTSTS